MIQTVKLTSRHFAGPAEAADDDLPIVYTHSDTWISNGHFLIARDNVLNGYLVKPDVFGNNFKRPSTPAHDVDKTLPDFDEFMGFDPTHRFRVTRWTYANGKSGASDDDPVRLLLQVGENADETDDDAGSKSIGAGPSSAYFCIISDVYADALGLEPGDILEAFVKHTTRSGGIIYVLRSEDCTRAVASRPFKDVDLEYLAIVQQTDEEMTPSDGRLTGAEKESARQQATAGKRGRGKARYKIEAADLAGLLD